MYYIKLNENNKIIGYMEGIKIDDSYIEVTKEEYQKAFIYEEYNQETKEFDVLKEIFKTNLQLAKEEKIKTSKTMLSNWLEKNPLVSSVHKEEAFYSVTEEKQNLLTRNLIFAQSNNLETTIWNAQGKVGEEWTVIELSQLALEIEAYVRPRIKKQQEYEVQINNCSTVEEIEQIIIEYDTI